MSGHDHSHDQNEANGDGHVQDDHAHDDHNAQDSHAGHAHAPATFGRAFAIGITLNAAYVAAQVFYGLIAHSVALLADAVHNLGDVLGLVLAWLAMRLARRRPTRTRTYGWGRGTILASLANAMVLLIGCGAIGIEALQRFSHPQAVAGGLVMWVAAAGIAINGVTALMFMRGRKDDLNIRGAFLHMAADAAVSAGVVIAALLIQFTGWAWLDPVTSLLIVVVIIAGTWSLLRESMNLAMDMVPAGIKLSDVEQSLLALPGVVEVHDLHVWALSTCDTALTAHLIQGGPGDGPGLIAQASAVVATQFNIGHSTFQVETADTADACGQRPADVV